MKRFLFFPLWLILCYYCCICNAQTSLPTNAIKIGKCVVRGKVPAMLAMKSSLTVVRNDFFVSNADTYDLSIDAEGNVSGEIPLHSLYAHAGVQFDIEENRQTEVQDVLLFLRVSIGWTLWMVVVDTFPERSQE